MAVSETARDGVSPKMPNTIIGIRASKTLPCPQKVLAVYVYEIDIA